jgi:hypothetical protein
MRRGLSTPAHPGSLLLVALLLLTGGGVAAQQLTPFLGRNRWAQSTLLIKALLMPLRSRWGLPFVLCSLCCWHCLAISSAAALCVWPPG